MAMMVEFGIDQRKRLLTNRRTFLFITRREMRTE